MTFKRGYEAAKLAKPRSRLEAVLGPRVKYRRLLLASPSSLILLETIYTIIGRASLVRDLVEGFVGVSRKMWSHLFARLPFEVVVYTTHFDLFTLLAVPIAGAVVASKRGRVEYSLSWHLGQLKKHGAMVRTLALPVPITSIITFAGAFAVPALAAKLNSELGRQAVAVQIVKAGFVVVLYATWFVSRAVWSRARYARWEWPSVTVLLLIPFFGVVMVWFVLFEPNLELPVSLGQLTLGWWLAAFSPFILAVCFCRNWVTIREVVVLAALLLLSDYVIELSSPAWQSFAPRVREFLGLDGGK
jgi:hypothetical protein